MSVFKSLFVSIKNFTAVSLFITTFCLSLKAEDAVQADKFVDSIGVNTHLSWGAVYQDNFPLILQRLQELGVRHIRNGLVDMKTTTPYYDHLTQLQKAGIKILLITSPDQNMDLVTSYPDRAPQSIEAFESPNEYDINGKSNWVQTLKTYVPTLYRAVNGDTSLASMPVVGPSLTQQPSYPALGNQSTYIDFGNMHNYPAGRNPGTIGWGGYDSKNHKYGSILWNLDLGIPYWGGKPTWTTEYGYTNDPTSSQGVPENVAATYLPRALAEQYMAGIQRTYIFELLTADPQHDDNYALLHGNGSPKPAFTAVKNLIQLLSDKGTAFSTSDLDFTLSGNTTNVHHLLLQKRDSTFYLLLWIEQPRFDVDTKKAIAVPSQDVTINFWTKPTALASYQLQETGGLTSANLAANQIINLQISDKVLILKVKAPVSK